MTETLQSGYHSRCLPSYRVLDDEQILALHRATLDILETVGVKVLHDQALDLLAGAGCRILADNVVTIPGWLVDQSIASAPKTVRIYRRDASPAMDLGGRNVYFGLGTDLLHTRDLDSGQLRPSQLGDVTASALVADWCGHIDFVAANAFPADVPDPIAYVAAFKAMASATAKPIYFTAAGEKDLKAIIAMAAAIAGSPDSLRRRPFLIHYSEPTSPLVHSPAAVDKLLACADAAIPLNYVPAVLAGGTAPVTLAAAIAVANAEALSGLVIHQLRAKGAPMISGFSVTPMDMAHGSAVYSSPEERLTHTACAQLYRHYGLPVWGEAGCSDAKLLDEQAAADAAISILMAALDGTNLVHDVGYLGQGMIGCAAAILMGNEIIGFVKRMLRGFEISPATIDLKVIARVGHGGHYLGQKQTRDWFRREHWRPTWMDKAGIDAWQKAGSLRYGEVLARKAREIVASHPPCGLAPDLAEALQAVYDKAATDLTG